MLLREISITDFGCLERLSLDNLDRLAVIIGENDTGKTVLLNAIDLLLSNSPASQDHFRRLPDGATRDQITLEATFILESHDTLPDDYRSGSDKAHLQIRRTYTRTEARTTVVGQGYSDGRFDDFRGRDLQMELLREYNLPPASREEDRRQQVDQLLSSGRLTRVERDLAIPQFSLLRPHLPAVVRIAAADYQTPEALIQHNLVSVGKRVLQPVLSDGNTPQERESLRELRQEIEDRMNDELAKAVSTLKQLHPRLRQITVEPSIDFERAVAAPRLILDLGEGDQTLHGFGEGTKRRLWLGLLEWERELTRQTAPIGLLRLYDEPDANLHYDAQRQLFSNIADLSADAGLRTQCFVCTHSVVLIDRAPLQSINLLTEEDDHRRSLTRLQATDDPSITEFFTEIADSVGLSNVALFYEKAFLVIEGESEEEFIRYIYRFLYSKSLREDGIVLVNLRGCGAWKSVLDVLLKNRAGLTHFLFDADCQQPGSAGYMTVEFLQGLGLPPAFQTQHVTYIGNKEFEDAFSDDVIARGFNDAFPRPDGQQWRPRAIAALRQQDKFSDA